MSQFRAITARSLLTLACRLNQLPHAATCVGKHLLCLVLGEFLLRPLLRDRNVIRSGITGYLVVPVLSCVLDCSAALLTRPVNNFTRLHLSCGPFLVKLPRSSL